MIMPANIPTGDLATALDLLKEMTAACAAATRVITRANDELLAAALDAELKAVGVTQHFDKRAQAFLKANGR